MITQKRLRAILYYCPETGDFRWVGRSLKGPSRIGRVAGSIKKVGYRYIGVDGVGYLAHRLAWLYMTGKMPDEHIDHKNDDKTDNRWANLRAATASQNAANTGVRKNNKSGFKGVSRHRTPNKWEAKICVDGERLYLGVFDSPNAAHEAYKSAALDAFGEFARFA